MRRRWVRLLPMVASAMTLVLPLIGCGDGDDADEGVAGDDDVAASIVVMARGEQLLLLACQ